MIIYIVFKHNTLLLTLMESKQHVTLPFWTSTWPGGWANLHSRSTRLHFPLWCSLHTSKVNQRESFAPGTGQGGATTPPGTLVCCPGCCDRGWRPAAAAATAAACCCWIMVPFNNTFCADIMEGSVRFTLSIGLVVAGFGNGLYARWTGNWCTWDWSEAAAVVADEGADDDDDEGGGGGETTLCCK